MRQSGGSFRNEPSSSRSKVSTQILDYKSKYNSATLELQCTYTPDSTDSGEERLFYVEVDRILYEVNEREDLSTRERWEEALNQVKKLRKKGITAFFRNTVAEPPVPAPITKTPENFTVR